MEDSKYPQRDNYNSDYPDYYFNEYFYEAGSNYTGNISYIYHGSVNKNNNIIDFDVVPLHDRNITKEKIDKYISKFKELGDIQLLSNMKPYKARILKISEITQHDIVDIKKHVTLTQLVTYTNIQPIGFYKSEYDIKAKNACFMLVLTENEILFKIGIAIENGQSSIKDIEEEIRKDMKGKKIKKYTIVKLLLGFGTIHLCRHNCNIEIIEVCEECCSGMYWYECKKTKQYCCPDSVFQNKCPNCINENAVCEPDLKNKINIHYKYIYEEFEECKECHNIFKRQQNNTQPEANVVTFRKVRTMVDFIECTIDTLKLAFYLMLGLFVCSIEEFSIDILFVNLFENDLFITWNITTLVFAILSAILIYRRETYVNLFYNYNGEYFNKLFVNKKNMKYILAGEQKDITNCIILNNFEIDKFSSMKYLNAGSEILKEFYKYSEGSKYNNKQPQYIEPKLYISNKIQLELQVGKRIKTLLCDRVTFILISCLSLLTSISAAIILNNSIISDYIDILKYIFIFLVKLNILGYIYMALANLNSCRICSIQRCRNNNTSDESANIIRNIIVENSEKNYMDIPIYEYLIFLSFVNLTIFTLIVI